MSPAPIVDAASLRLYKKKFNFFETPEPLADRMAAWIDDLAEGSRIPWNACRPGGRIVALVGMNATDYIDEEFLGYVFERDVIPKNTFEETAIKTCLYLIHKPLFD